MLGSNSNKHVLVKGGGLWKIDCKIEATVSYCVPFFYSNISPIHASSGNLKKIFHCATMRPQLQAWEKIAPAQCKFSSYVSCEQAAMPSMRVV